jgi:hypothetical protein
MGKKRMTDEDMHLIRDGYGFRDYYDCDCGTLGDESGIAVYEQVGKKWELLVEYPTNLCTDEISEFDDDEFYKFINEVDEYSKI